MFVVNECARQYMCIVLWHAGPVTAEAIFLNREELPVRPLYYDPIHDFGEHSLHDPDSILLQAFRKKSCPLLMIRCGVGMDVH